MQAATGLGAGLIIVPLLALVSFHLVPAPMIFASIALSSMMAYRGRKNIDQNGLGTITAGLVTGTVIAALFIAAIPASKLGIVFGIILLAAVGVTLFLKAIPFRPTLLLVTGFVSGIMGTAAGIGAPVLALLYQNHQSHALRATLAFLYLVSSLMMLFFLHLAGRFGPTGPDPPTRLFPGEDRGFPGSCWGIFSPPVLPACWTNRVSVPWFSFFPPSVPCC